MLGIGPISGMPISASHLQAVYYTGTGGMVIGGVSSFLHHLQVTGSGGVILGGISQTRLNFIGNKIFVQAASPNAFTRLNTTKHFTMTEV